MGLALPAEGERLRDQARAGRRDPRSAAAVAGSQSVKAADAAAAAAETAAATIANA